MHVHQHSAPRARRVKVQGHEPEMQHISRSLPTTNERTAEYCELWPTQHGGEASYGSRSDAVSGQAPRHLSCMYRGFRRHSPLAAQWRQRSACPSAASGSCLPLLAACASHVPHDAAHCLCMKIEFLPHSPLAAHSAHRVEESLQGSTTAAPAPAPAGTPVPPPPAAASCEAADTAAGTDSSSRRESPCSSSEASVATGSGEDLENDTAAKQTAPRKMSAPTPAAVPR